MARKFSAVVVDVRCKHLQEDEEQDTYAALELTDERGTWMLKLPMWQYTEPESRRLLQRIAEVINGHEGVEP